MFEQPQIILSLANDVLQAAIVIFGLSVALYNLPHSLRDRVTRAFNSLLFFVAVVYFAELIATRAAETLSTEVWIRLGWIGIAMVPAAQFHLSDALLVTTGSISRIRRTFVRIIYLTGVTFFILALSTDLVVGDLVEANRAPHLRAGAIFSIFSIYFWAASSVSIYNGWRARERCLTNTTRRRMTVIVATFVAAPLGVFPYLLLASSRNLENQLLFWIVVVLGNIVISVMFAFMTYYIAYFGATSPDRVVRVRLLKFMARVPMAATAVLVVFVLISRAGSILGLHVETALAIGVVVTILLVEWAVYAFKRWLERIFQLTDEPEVRNIQILSERVLTTRDMRQFLESVLAATCEILRTPTAFVAAFTSEGPKLEAIVGSLEDQQDWDEKELKQLGESARRKEFQDDILAKVDNFIVWRDFWLQPLLSHKEEVLVGILGIRARSTEPDLTDMELSAFERLVDQATEALEDRVLQQEVFAAVEGLLPQVTDLQRKRSAATFGGVPVLTASSEEQADLTSHPDLNSMVWDALSHYWGGPKLTESPLMRLRIVQRAVNEYGGNPTNALRDILIRAVEQQKPEGDRNLTAGDWILYNILELKFIQGLRVRDVARRLAMSESDLYRKQRVAIENVARSISSMEEAVASPRETREITDKPTA